MTRHLLPAVGSDKVSKRRTGQGALLYEICGEGQLNVPPYFSLSNVCDTHADKIVVRETNFKPCSRARKERERLPSMQNHLAPFLHSSNDKIVKDKQLVKLIGFIYVVDIYFGRHQAEDGVACSTCCAEGCSRTRVFDVYIGIGNHKVWSFRLTFVKTLIVFF